MAFWPSSVATDADLYVATNSLQTTLATALGTGDVSVVLASATGFPTAGGVTIGNEVIFYTNISGSTLTGCTRGADGTTAATHSVGVPVGASVIAFHHNGLKDEIKAIESYLNTVLGKSTSVVAAEFAYLAGVTSAIQTQLNLKAPLASPTFSGTITTPLTASRALVTGASSELAVSAVTAIELGYLSGVTSAVQTQITARALDSAVVHNTGVESISGAKTFADLRGTFGANIAAGSNKITGLAAGSSNGDSLRYEQVIGQFLLLAGGTMAGNIAMGSNKITGLAAATSNGDAVRYEQLTGTYLLLSGGTMAGNIAMGSNKITGLGAASANGDALRYEQLNTLWGYRRTNLVWNSITRVDVENNTGTANQTTYVFPDGEVRSVTENLATTQNYRSFKITQNAAFASGTIQGGLRTTLSEANNTWYALYAVKCTKVGEEANFVIVGDTLLPLQANFATLNSNFGTNGWIYLGMIRNGDNSGTAGDILNFVQHGHTTIFLNVCLSATTADCAGIRVANTAGALTLTYTYAAGTGAAQIPDHLGLVNYYATSTISYRVGNAAGTLFRASATDAATDCINGYWTVAAEGCKLTSPSGTPATSIFVAGFTDGVLGVGSNPLL